MRAYPYRPFQMRIVGAAKSSVRTLLLLWLGATIGFFALIESGSRAHDIRGIGDFLFSFALSAALTALPTLALWALYRLVRFAFR